MNKQDKIYIGIAVVAGLFLLGSIIPALVSAKSSFLALVGLAMLGGYVYGLYEYIFPIIKKITAED